MHPAVSVPTLVAAAASYNLIDLATLKTLFGVTDTSNDALFNLLIPQASAKAQKFCANPFVIETIRDQIFPPRDGRPWTVRTDLDLIQLSRRPIVTIASVVETIAGVATTLVAGTDYIANMEFGQLTRLDSTGRPRNWHGNPVAVQYDAGFATIPPDVVLAVSKLVKADWFGQDRDPATRSRNAVGVFEESYVMGSGPGAEDGMPADIAADLKRYRVPRFG